MLTVLSNLLVLLFLSDSFGDPPDEVAKAPFLREEVGEGSLLCTFTSSAFFCFFSCVGFCSLSFWGFRAFSGPFFGLSPFFFSGNSSLEVLFLIATGLFFPSNCAFMIRSRLAFKSGEKDFLL